MYILGSREKCEEKGKKNVVDLAKMAGRSWQGGQMRLLAAAAAAATGVTAGATSCRPVVDWSQTGYKRL